MNAKILIFFILLASFFANAQTPLGINTNLSPDGKLDNIFDRFGNQYKLADIVVQPSPNAGAGLIASTPTCTSGMFELYFEAGSGMEGITPIENQRRAVVCQVFQDVSNFINSPLKNAGNTQKVKIWVRDINKIPFFTPQVLGLASGFFNFPATPTPPINGGIADNEIWKTIHAGVDSYIGVVPPISSSFYHGLMAINFNGINWNLNLNANATSAQNDLYSVVLHEVTHALGFASQISANGSSNFAAGNNYFSRYDSKLKDSNNNFLIQQNATTECSNMYNYNFSLSENILHPTCGLSGGLNLGSSADATFDCNTAIRYQAAPSSTIQVYTPRCFENGSSLSHFEDQCFVNPATGTAYGNNNYFVMSNANANGSTKRFLKLEERQALCDIGYSVNTTYATGQTYAHTYLDISVCQGNSVGGMNDGLTATNYSFIGNAGTDIAITGILNNDVSYTYSGGVATNNIANLRFECLQDVYFGTTTAAPTTGSMLSQIATIGNTASATITFRSLVPGVHLLRYVPYDIVSGLRGNITYVYIFVYPLANNCLGLSPNTCNMVQNADFEYNNNNPPSGAGEINKACGWYNVGGYSTDYFHGNSTSALFDVPCNLYGELNDRIVGNNSYAGLFITSALNNSNSEMLGTIINTPLAPNTNYSISFDVSLSHLGGLRAFELQFLLTQDASVFSTTSINLTQSQINNGIFRTSQQVFVKNAWQTLTFNFNSGSGGQKYLIIGGLYKSLSTIINPVPSAYLSNCSFTTNIPNFPNDAYYYIDNVSLVPTYNATLDLPATLCGNNSLPDLSNFVQNAPPKGVFSGTGVTVNAGNVYSFNPTTSGTYTITYTYVSSPGCPAVTITDTIIFDANCAQPFISQVYVGDNPNDYYIEVKNRSNTQSITAQQFYLNNYADGQATNVGWIDIGAFAPLEVKVFRGHLAGTGGTSPQVAGTIITLPADFAFDGNNDILNLSGFYKYQRALDEIVDIAGNSDAWCVGRSLVRSSCAVAYPRLDLFDIDDWAVFSLNEVQSGNSLTNAVLGRHNYEPLIFSTSSIWTEANLSNNSSLPDRSREVIIFGADYDTTVQGNLEACSINIGDFRTLTIAPNTYVSVEVNISMNQFGRIDVQNEGNLVMVKDCYNNICGPDLVNLGTTGTIKVTKETVGLDSSTDYVFWSSPLSSKPSNLPANSVQGLFPTPQFNPNRFYNFKNANFFDGFDQSLNPTPDGYDDNDDDFQVLNTIERNQLMTPGQGYCNWPPAGTSTNYNINFNGQANNGKIIVPLFKNLAFGDNTNLVGNPYPSPILLDKLFELNAGLIDPVAYIWGRSNDDPSGSNPGPDPLNYSIENYMVYNPTMIVVSCLDCLPFNSQGILSSCQSFFVNTVKDPDVTAVTNATGTILPAGDLVFNNSMRTTAPNSTFARQANPKPEKENKLWLNLADESGNKTAQIMVAFLEKATDKYDPTEDVKAFNGRKLNFYTKTGDQDLIIDAQNKFSSDKTIALGIINIEDKQQKLTISTDKLGGIFKEQPIYIFDKATNRINNISKESYSFAANKSIIEDRFILLFDNKINSDISQSASNNVLVYAKDNVLNVVSLNKKIMAIYLLDIYTPSTSGVFISKNENINNKNFQQFVDNKYKILNVKIVLDDGSAINKKIML